jgi:hypothetical protein
VVEPEAGAATAVRLTKTAEVSSPRANVGAALATADSTVTDNQVDGQRVKMLAPVSPTLATC